MRSEIKFGISTLLAMASTLVTGCSGGGNKSAPAASAAYTIGGTVTGLTGTGLVLQNAGSNGLTVSTNATSFSFTTPVPSNDIYSVVVSTQPVGETCMVTNGSGTAAAAVTNIAVTCTPLDTIGGTITGLINPGLVLQDNGGDNLTLAPSATSFTFPTPLANGGAYLVAVLAQPLGETCVVSNGGGTATVAVTNVTVSCTPLFEVSGTITGLNRTGLVLQNNSGDNLTVSAQATGFTFPTPLANGGAYKVTVLTQPASENCTVINGSGKAATNVTAPSVVCVGDWTWTGGSNSLGLTGGLPGIYGTLNTPDPANLPGGREQATTWTDASGNAWLFGGNGADFAGTVGVLNDLWKFDPALGAKGEWTWISGSKTALPGLAPQDGNGQPGVYGMMGTAAPTNVPGGREQMVSWKDAAGNLWLLGGFGIDANGSRGYLNDLWKFDLQASEWTWMAGSSTVRPPDAFGDYFGPPGVYGTLGTAASTNVPGGRYGAMAWADASGNFWLFGGNGFDSVTNTGYLSDLWKFTPGSNGSAGNWTWMGGSNTVPSGGGGPFGGGPNGLPGVYGTLGVAASANMPGGRSSGVSWTDASGNFWIFGGLGADSAGTFGYLNDLWEYTPGASGTAGQWTWLSGSNTIDSNDGQPGVYGIQGTADAADVPGARFSSSVWVDASGSFWLFGGQGYDWTDTPGWLSDLWKYTPSNGNLGQWTWMGGSDAVPPPTQIILDFGQPGVYGMLGTPAAANTPGGRFGAATWVDSSGSLWLLGGHGTDSTGTPGYLNDAWKYQP